MKTLKLSILLIILSATHVKVAHAWGPMGHELIGELAEPMLKPASKDKIAQLLGDETIAHATTYLDRMRGQKDKFWQKTASPWHYVTVPNQQNYQANLHAPKRGDAYTALMHYSKQLAQSTNSEQQKLALYFVLHLVGDIHQPLHAGNGEDRGGNDFAVYFQNKRTNMHRLWDSQMLATHKHSYWIKTLSAKISALSNNSKQEWQNSTAIDWINESVQIRQNIYPAKEKAQISQSYLENNLSISEQRIIQAAVRLAHQLNILLAD
ncbi:S1/P1 nuclease [Catenovulum agarivorans]|uniref:S1/P1 nuclease n=1 Tax=Catenovulum agarivorans TaxID=1172192 RepID=UPI0005900632|nr:S1/P1 nuclease [Catenovulum agarivorans]